VFVNLLSPGLHMQSHIRSSDEQPSMLSRLRFK